MLILFIISMLFNIFLVWQIWRKIKEGAEPVFYCEKEDYSIDELIDFSLNTGKTVIIKNYGIVRDGMLTIFHQV